MGEEEPVTVVVGVPIIERGEHFAGLKGRAGMHSACGVTDANRLVLRQGGRHPGNIVVFMLARAWSEEKDGSSEKGMNDGLLKRGNDAGVDGGIHEVILNGVEAVSKDVVVSRDAHVSCHRRWCLICLSGWQREEMCQLSFGLFVDVPI